MDASDHCIPANPDISGIGVRAAIYAQNLLCFAPVIAHLWDGKVSADELKGVQDQSIGMLSVAFAILISTIVEAKAKGRPLITSFHAAVILDLSWMNNTSTFIWFLLYAHHRSKAENEISTIAPTWRDWAKALLSPLSHLIGTKKKIDGDRTGVVGDAPQIFKRLQILVFRAPVLTLGSLHLSLMAAIGIWLWSDQSKFGETIPCDPSLSIVGGAVHFSSPALRIGSLLIYSLVLIPGINLVPPFMIFITLHILYNKSRKRYPMFWSRIGRNLRSVPYTILRRQVKAPSDEESQRADPTVKDRAQSPPSEAHTTFLLIGLGCLAAINIIFLIDIELTLAHNDTTSEEDNQWGFGQVLALLLLVVPVRDFVSSIVEIRRKLREPDKYAEERTHRFQDALQNAIEANRVDGERFKALIQNGAHPDTQIDDPKFLTLFQLAAYSGEVDLVKFLVDKVNVNFEGGEYGTAIHASIANGKMEVVQLLLRTPRIKIDIVQGVSPTFERLAGKNKQIEAAFTVFCKASKSRDVLPTMVRILQRAGEDIRRDSLEGLSRLAEIAEWHKQIRTAIPGMIAALKDRDKAVRRAALKGLSHLAEIAEWREEIQTAIPSMIATLKDPDEAVGRAALEHLSHLAHIAEWHKDLRPAILGIVGALKDANLRDAALNSLLHVAGIAEWHEDMLPAIPRLIKALKDTKPIICKAALNSLSGLAKIAEWHKEIQLGIPGLITGLKDANWRVRQVSLEALSRLAEIAEWRDETRPAISQMIAALKDMKPGVRNAALNSLSLLAKIGDWHEEVRAALPGMITSLEDSNSSVRQAALDGLSCLADNVEWRKEIRPAIPGMILALKDSKLQVREAALQCLSLLARIAEGREEIRPAIPGMIAVLNDSTRPVALKWVSDLARIAEWREDIRPAIPRISSALKDEDKDVRDAALNSLLCMAEIVEWHEEIRSAILGALNDSKLEPAVRLAGLECLSPLANIAVWREEIRPAIPGIIETFQGPNVFGIDASRSLLSLAKIAQEWREELRPAIPRAMEDLMKHSWFQFPREGFSCLANIAEWHEEIRAVIPGMISALKDSEEDACEAALECLSCLADIAEWREDIRPAIPGIIAAVKHSDISHSALKSLSCLSKIPALREEIRPAIPEIVAGLEDPDVRHTILDSLSDLGTIPEWHEEIRPAIPSMIGALKDPNSSVRQAALECLSHLADIANPRVHLSRAVTESDVEDSVIVCFTRTLVALGQQAAVLG